MSDTDLLQLVMDGMGWEKKKAQKWFNVPNPLLGGATPNGFELMCGKMKLEKFIREQLAQNPPTVKPSPHAKGAERSEKGRGA